MKYILETHVTVYHLVVNCLSFSIIFVGFPGVLLLINFRKSSLLREPFKNVKGVPPPPTPLTENQCEKKKVFFLSGKGGYPHPPLNGESAKLFREIFS